MSAWVFGEFHKQVEVGPSLLRTARAVRHLAAPLDVVCEAVDAVHALWNPSGRARQRWLATTPERELGSSRPMVERALDAVCHRLSGGELTRRVAQQLGDPSALGGFVRRQNALLHTAPRGVVLHVVEGSVFFGPAEALVAGLATGNVNIVKEPAGDAEFLAHFILSLAEACPRVLDSVAVVRWRGGDAAIEEPLARAVDAILIAASPDTIRAYRRMAGPVTEIVELP